MKVNESSDYNAVVLSQSKLSRQSNGPNLILKIIIVAQKTFKDLGLVFERFSVKNFRDFLWNALTLSIFELEKHSFFLIGQNFARNWLVPLSEC